MKKIKVLVVDDSLVFRQFLTKGISTDLSIEVVGTATDPFEARDKIIELEPDVMTCDVQMPKMNGIEFLRRLLPQYHLPVIVVSTVSEAILDALNVGAVDFVTKPNIGSINELETFIDEVIHKIKVATIAKVSQMQIMQPKGMIANIPVQPGRIIAIGASTGGTEAIYQILKSLPPSIPGILVVQHIPPMFSRMFAERLNNQTQLNVRETKNGDYVEKGQVLIAPGDRHIRIKKIDTKYRVECFEGEKVNGHCPSVDVLFESVAKEAGDQAIGIILTGMGYDGAKGLRQMRRKGARTIGQDEQSSVVYGMPKVAYDIGAVEKQVDLKIIPSVLCSMLK